jgi:hypothetical protein
MQVAWLGQIRYLSFFQYGYEALVANEMAGRKLTNLPVESGTAVLAQLGRCRSRKGLKQNSRVSSLTPSSFPSFFASSLFPS